MNVVLQPPIKIVYMVTMRARGYGTLHEASVRAAVQLPTYPSGSGGTTIACNYLGIVSWPAGWLCPCVVLVVLVLVLGDRKSRLYVVCFNKKRYCPLSRWKRGAHVKQKYAYSENLRLAKVRLYSETDADAGEWAGWLTI